MRASECCGMKLVPSISSRSRVISSTIDGVVQKPPAAERQQVSKFSRDDAEFVLILAAQHADQETIVRKLKGDILNRAHIGAADSVAGKAQCRIDLAANADHQRHRQMEFPACGKNRFAEELRPNVVFRKDESVFQRDGHVDRLHAGNPVRQESPDFFHRCAPAMGVHGISLRRKRAVMRGPLIENPIDAHDGRKMRIRFNAAHPHSPLLPDRADRSSSPHG